MIKNRIIHAGLTSILTIIILTILRLKLDNGIFVLDRFFKGLGWIQIIIVTGYSFIVTYHLLDINKSEQWRKYIWILFTIVFFTQFILGLFVDNRCLMSGKIHLPIPMVILGGIIYRIKIGFMPVLFISTIILTGPSWCSYLCYFGAMDNWAASGKRIRNKPVKNLFAYKYSILSLVVITAVIMKVSNFSNIAAGITAILFGTTGMGIIILISRKRKKMIHCIVFCPIGTITSFLKYLSLFRMKISNTCTSCIACSLKCKYDALNLKDIQKGRPGITCTFCGDCLSACHELSITYALFQFDPVKSRIIFTVIIMVVHSVFLTIARI